MPSVAAQQTGLTAQTRCLAQPSAPVTTQKLGAAQAAKSARFPLYGSSLTNLWERERKSPETRRRHFAGDYFVALAEALLTVALER
jgi:hypothetical protein